MENNQLDKKQICQILKLQIKWCYNEGKQNKIMTYRSKPDLLPKKKYSNYYFKKLQTQSSIDKIDHQALGQTTDILEKQIQKMEKSLYQRNSLYARTLKRKSQIEKEQQNSRQELKSRIQQKMKKSQQNLLSYLKKSSSSLSTRLQVQARKIQEIKRNQKSFYDQTYQKSKQLSKSTERFFSNLTEKQKTKSTHITLHSQVKANHINQPLPQPQSKKVRKAKIKGIINVSMNLNPEQNQSLLEKIKVKKQTVEQKQIKKLNLQKAKQDQFLQQYASKLEHIQVARKKSQLERKVPQSTISKTMRRQNFDDNHEECRKFSKSYIGQAVNSKSQFSEEYQRRLNKTKQRTEFFLNQSLASGDLILKGDIKQKSKYKLNKLIRDTQNQVARKQNFRYMQRYLNKRF